MQLKKKLDDVFELQSSKEEFIKNNKIGVEIVNKYHRESKFKETNLLEQELIELSKDKPITEPREVKSSENRLYHYNTNSKWHPSRFDELKNYGFISIWNNVSGYDILEVDNIFAAYVSGIGYVAIGRIEDKIRKTKDILENNKELKPLIIPIEPRNPEDRRNDAKNGLEEYLYKVKWIKIVDKKDAVRGYGYRRTICKIKDIKTINNLKEKFKNVKFSVQNIAQKNNNPFSITFFVK